MSLASPISSSPGAPGRVDAAAIPGRDEGPLVPLVVDLDGTLLRTDLLLSGWSAPPSAKWWRSCAATS